MAIDIKLVMPDDSIHWCGFRIAFDKDMVDKKWEFPYDRFIEYGPEDEWWAIPMGFGRWKITPKNEAVQVGDRLIMHPGLWDYVKKWYHEYQESYRKSCEVKPPSAVKLFA